LDWPVKGVLFDVEHNVYWSDACGSRPHAIADAVAQARARLAAVPQLVPVYAHRYMPSGRTVVGHPVLSVYQTDVIYYGMDLLDYVRQEFRAGSGIDRTDRRWRPQAFVAFWRDLIE
jgi:hypothetical protein